MRDTKRDVLNFWFNETEPAQWFQKNPDFDQSIRDRFQMTYTMARDGVCDGWNGDVEGVLALCLVLDQFPRNMFRDTAQAFATDDQALAVARRALTLGYDQILPVIQRRFIYLPFEHSERMEDQEKSVSLFAAMRDEDPLGYEYAVRHRDVIAQFGRFPHRNAVLGRANTEAEGIYLSQPGAGF